MGDVTDKAEAAGRRTHDSKWMDHAIRAGLVAYGVVHLLVAWLAVQLALGDKSENASNNGAMRALAEQPMGGVLIWAVAIGLILLVCWRVLEAALGHQDETNDAKRWRKRAASAGKAVLYGVLALSAIKTALGNGSSGNTDSTTAKLMDLPAGQWIVALIGLGIIGFGGGLVHRGWSEKFTDNLDAEGTSGTEGSAYVMFGKVGYIAKGIAIAVVGGLFVYAGVTHEAKKSGGLDQALQTVREQPFGAILLIGIALGIACYGLFSFARAKHLSR